MKLYRLFRHIPIINTKIFKFTRKVTVFKKRGDTYIPYYDVGKEVKFIGKENLITHKIYLRYDDAYAPMPDSKFVRGDKSLAYIEVGDKDYVPCEIVVDEKGKKVKLNLFESSILQAKALVTQEMRETVETVRKQGFWEKYGGVVLPIVYFVIAGIMLVMVLKQTTTITSGLGGVANKISQIVDKLGNIAGQIGSGISQATNSTPPPG